MKTINSFRSKLLALTLALMASVSTFAQAPDFKVGELYYQVLEGDTVEVTYRQRPVLPTADSTATPKKNSEGLGYENFTEVVIPSMITYEDKTYHVTRIGHGTFWLCDKLTYVDIPNTIKSIGIAAFRSCRTLTSITLNEGLESIEHHAFYDCVRLKEVTLPSTLKTMGQGIFYFSTDLEKVTCKAIVPPTVEKDVLTATDNYNASIIPNATLYVPASSLTTYQNTYPWNTFGQILSIEDSLQNIFPTLAGLQRTHTIEMYDYAPNDGKRSGGYPLPFASVKDTVINGKTYLQFGDHVNGSNYSLFFLREENNKVLIYSSILQNDLVLYDYTLELGDSLPAITSDHDYFSDDHFTKLDKAENIFTYVVTDVSTVTLLDGIERKKWILKNKYLPIIEYVEGIGCYGENTSDSGDFFRLIHDHPYTTEYVGDHLVCVSKNGQLLYSMPQEEMNSFTLTCECLSQEDTIAPKDLFPTLWGLQRTDVELHTTGDDEAYRSAFNEYVPTLVNGKWYLYDGRNYLREENNQVLLYAPDVEIYEDIVLYDWTLEVGDTLPYHNKSVYRKSDYIVTDVSTITLLDGKEYKKWTLACGYEYIESIGAINGHGYGLFLCLPHYGHWATYIHTSLVCASRNGKLLYQMDEAEMERLGAECLCQAESPEDLFPTLWGLQRTSCTKTIGEDEYGTVWGSRSYLMQETQTTTIDGKQYMVFGDDQYNRFALREENNKILVYSSILKKDLVLYDFTLEVGDSLPALYFEWRAHNAMQQWLYIGDIVDYNKDDNGTILPAETFVVTDISTITLLDGKEYKKWTFDNGMEYVKGIGSFGTNYAWNDFYQLIANGPLYSDVHSQHLVCVSKNGQLLYQMDEAEMERLGTECLCDYNSGPKKDNAKNGKIGGRPTPTQWNMLEVETKEMDGTPTITRAETFSYTLENDSIVTKGKTFYQLARQSTKDTAITKSFVGALHFGEDEDNRVYFLRDGVEYVLYDFTAEPGDSIEIFAGINNYPQETTYTHVVTGKDTLENGACRMFLEVVFPEETASVENAQKVWLAGLGSIDGIVHNAANRTSDAHAAPAKSASSETQSSVMLCAWRDDNCLYTTNHPEYDTFGCVYNQDPTAVEDVQTSGDKYQKIIRNGHLYILRDNKLYDVLGTPMN